MILLVCSCLNIRVHGKGTVPSLRDVNSLNISENARTDPFFASGVYDVTLDLGGVTMAQKLLCKVRCADGWLITSCNCCMLDVYAKQAEDDDRVLVSNRAEKESNVISSLMESDRYSPLFKLMLPEINDNFIQNNIGIELRNGNLDHSIEHVQHQVSNYLKDEQKAMEDRIRRFTEQQQSKYADLLQRVRKHKQAMVYLLLKSKEVKNPNQVESAVESPLASPASVANRDITNESSTSTDSAFDRSDASDFAQEDKGKQQNMRSLRRTLSNPARPGNKPKRGLRKAPLSVDVGGVFDMEEFDTKELGSCNSDEDSEGSETSNMDDGVEKAEGRLMCATSLPMSIPAFSNFTHFSIIDDEEKMPSLKDPEQIAASMRALACSVRDGTEMFGELPRRRLNTGELLSSRPL